jgi:predicted enzyme related to lactoylglutathione lyase
MPIASLRTFVLDVDDLDEAKRFWSALTGLPVVFTTADGRYARVGPDQPGSILLQRVPEAKDERKNRAHLDLTVTDLAAAAEQVAALGGAEVGEPLELPGVRWRVMTDPSGNEFCLVQELG